MLYSYLNGLSPIQRRNDRIVVKSENNKPAYYTPVREGNKAFPVFNELKNSKKILKIWIIC